jgi:hypothetical protein
VIEDVRRGRNDAASGKVVAASGDVHVARAKFDHPLGHVQCESERHKDSLRLLWVDARCNSAWLEESKASSTAFADVPLFEPIVWVEEAVLDFSEVALEGGLQNTRAFVLQRVRNRVGRARKARWDVQNVIVSERVEPTLAPRNLTVERSNGLTGCWTSWAGESAFYFRRIGKGKAVGVVDDDLLVVESDLVEHVLDPKAVVARDAFQLEQSLDQIVRCDVAVTVQVKNSVVQAVSLGVYLGTGVRGFQVVAGHTGLATVQGFHDQAILNGVRCAQRLDLELEVVCQTR